MLQNIFYFLLISIFCIIWGHVALYVILLKNKPRQLSNEQHIFSFFAGLALISILSSWVSLFTAVHFWILAALSLPTFVLWWKNRSILGKTDFKQFQKFSKIDIVFIISIVGLFLVLSAGKVVLVDADLYHLQTIKWIHEFGTVKGVANLYLRYGFYSNWFHLISIFQLPFEHQNYTYLNFTFNIWLFLFLYLQFKSFLHHSAPSYRHFSTFYFLIILFMLFEWDLFRVSSSSTTYDFVVTGTILVCFSLLLQKFLFKKSTLEQERLFLILTITAPFYKMTGFLLILFWLLLFYNSSERKRILSTSLFLAILSFIPFACKNYLQTGFIFFPYTFLNFSNPDWQVPTTMMDLFNKYIYLNNHYINRGAPNFPFTDFSSFSYYNDWFRYLVIEDRFLLTICIIAVPVFLYLLPKLYKEQYKKLLFMWLTCILATIFWLFSSPDLRFAFGYLIFLSFFPLSMLVYPYTNKKLFSLLMIGTIICSFFYSYKKANSGLTYINILRPVDIAKTPYKIIQLKDINFIIPTQPQSYINRCYDSPLPCIYQTNPYLEPLGDQLSNGFKMKGMPSREFVNTYQY